MQGAEPHLWHAQDAAHAIITPNNEVTALTRHARKSWQSLRRGEAWEDWVTIGRAIDAFRRQLYQELKITEPKGQRYKVAMADYLRANNWLKEESKPGEGIDDGARANLQHCVDHLPEIEAWRATLPLTNRLKLNHPNTVWRAFGKHKGQIADPSRRETEVQRLRQDRDDAIAASEELAARLEEKTARLEAETARADRAAAEAGFMWDEPVETAAEKLLKTQPEKARELAARVFSLTADDPQWQSVPKADEQIERILRMYHKLAVVADDGGKRAETIQNCLDRALHPATPEPEAVESMRAAARIAKGDRVLVTLNTELVDNEYVLVQRLKDQLWDQHARYKKLQTENAKLARKVDRLTAKVETLTAERDSLAARAAALEAELAAAKTQTDVWDLTMEEMREACRTDWDKVNDFLVDLTILVTEELKRRMGERGGAFDESEEDYQRRQDGFRQRAEQMAEAERAEQEAIAKIIGKFRAIIKTVLHPETGDDYARAAIAAAQRLADSAGVSIDKLVEALDLPGIFVKRLPPPEQVERMVA